MSFYLLSEDICPSITSEILNKLSEIKVKSVNDFLCRDLSKLRSISRTKRIDFKKLLEIKKQLYQRFGPKKFNAFDLVRNRSGFMTGIEMFDQMLVNGIKRGEVTELYGYPGSGKTQFCYTFAINLVHKYKKKVLFIDSGLSFSESRIRELASNKFSDQKMNDLISNIQVLTINNISSLIDTIETISYDLKNNPNTKYKDLGLVIIDCLSTPLTNELKKSTFDVEVEEKGANNRWKISNIRFRIIRLVSQIANTLDRFASENSMAVIAVNSQSFSLKSNWKNQCKLCLNFYDNENNEENNWVSNMYKTIKISRTYDKSIINKSYNKFKISSAIGFV